MSITAIVDCGSGNLRSAQKALERAAQERAVSTEVHVTQDPDLVRAAARVVLPGVGAFADCLHGLTGVSGLREALEEAVTRDAKPFLGICVGMQLMADRGLEHGTTAGFGWIKGEIAKMEVGALPVPHMGWNELRLEQPGHPVLEGLADGDHVYFVHSYALTGGAAQELAATADYAGPRVAAVARENMFGTQFHPEKSQAAGLQLLGNFLRWQP